VSPPDTTDARRAAAPAFDLRRFADFIGPAARRLLALGVVVGACLFAVELAFAYALQIFLQAVGVMSAAAARLPWAPASTTLPAALALVFLLGTARSLLYWAFVSLQGVADEGTRRFQRSRILSRALNADSAGLAEITTHFNARSVSAGQVAAGLQSLAVQATACVLLAFNLLLLAPRVTLVLGVALAALIPPLRWADRRTKGAGERMDAEWESLSRTLVVGIKNLLLLQIYGTQRREEERARRSLDNYAADVSSYHVLLGFKFALPQIFGLLLICLVALAGRRSGLAAGALVAYFYLFLRLMQSLSMVNQYSSLIVAYWPQTRELMNWWSRGGAADERRTGGEDRAAPLAPGPIGWDLRDVAFSFPGAGAPTVAGLSFSIPAGSAAAITGVSGAGKSTVLNLLLGVLTPSSGEIRVLSGGAEAAPLKEARAALLPRVGYVGPESFLIEGTVRENLAYGLTRPCADEELFRALDRAECGFVRELPRGLDHALTEQGQGLSAGQKQRLSLARALLKNPSVLVLDEPTANLDGETEGRLVDVLRALKGQMTIVAATHSPAVMAVADRRIRLD
jgi:ABC-type multidrug transport system fused ATPase/permease subunit